MRLFKTGILFFLLLIESNLIQAQQQFLLKDASKLYSAEMKVDTCDTELCQGRGTVKLISKKTGKLFQELYSDDLYFFVDKDFKPSVNIIELYGEQSPLYFDDFNFDGREDLAIRNGNNSGYGGPSYDVYLFDSTKNKFLENGEMTGLATDNLGMFQVDSKRKRIGTFAKSGCCWHLTTEYKVLKGDKLQEVYRLTEDATGGEKVKVTEEKLVNGKWQKKVKSHPIDVYYRN